MMSTPKENAPAPWYMKHSNAPWNSWYVYAANDRPICCTAFDTTTDREIAQQLAATPELLQACEYTRNHFRYTGNPMPDQIKAREAELVKVLDAAIAKAKK